MLALASVSRNLGIVGNSPTKGSSNFKARRNASSAGLVVAQLHQQLSLRILRQGQVVTDIAQCGGGGGGLLERGDRLLVDRPGTREFAFRRSRSAWLLSVRASSQRSSGAESGAAA